MVDWTCAASMAVALDIKITMSSELPKTYEPASVEATAYQTWLDAKAFHADPADPGEPFCIVIPPPNVTGALHLGHAINNTLQDILVRKARMDGHNAVWIPGIDHAGIATQAVVEKQLKENENKTRHDIGREALVQRIWEWKQKYGDRILSQLQRLGCSCDWDRARFTLDDMCARAVRETFFKLFKDGLVFRGKRLVNWDTHLQTSISDDEIYYETVKTFMWHIKYPIVDNATTGEEGRSETTKGARGAKNKESDFVPSVPFVANSSSAVSQASASSGVNPHPDFLVVATTRPETMLGDTAVAVNSGDPRWNWAIGKFVKLPLTDRLIPIIADDILVDPKFGTGCVKVTPAHDPNDYAVWQRHLGKADQIDLINILNSDGTLNENAGAYKGLRRELGRKQVIADLTHQGLLLKEEPYETQVGHSDRSKTVIEPYLSDQWFVHMAPLAEPALEVVRQGLVKFHPERHAQQYLAWLGEKRDWPISRQLWWGHRIPVWRIKAWPAEYYRPGEDLNQPLIQILEWQDAGRVCYQGAGRLASGLEDLAKDDLYFVAVRNPEDKEVVDYLESIGFVQDPDVLDTWFSSALWPHSTLGWPEKTPDLAKWNPTSVLITARDIITLWVARMVMMNLYNMGENRFTASSEAEAKQKLSDAADSKTAIPVPFAHVAINPTILDGKGERMSKSKGNGVDPVDIIDTHGADALRFTLTTMATETQDVRLPVQKLPDGRNTSDKFDLGRNFCNKVWNASRFAISNLEIFTAETTSHEGAPPCLSASVVDSLSLADKWILSRLARTVSEANEALATFRFDHYAHVCYEFFWRDFCDWYVEIIKPTLKDPKQAATTAGVLAAALDQSLRLMHPVIPFITETIWWKLNEVVADRSLPGLLDAPVSKLLIKAAWPTPGASLINPQVENDFTLLQETVIAIRNVRNEHKVDLKRIVQVTIAAVDESAARILLANQQTIQLLATCEIQAASVGASAPPDAVRTSAGNCDIFIAGMIDADAEKQRVARRKEDLTKLIATLESRLGNVGYIAKAPPHLVEQTQKQLADGKAELAKL